MTKIPSVEELINKMQVGECITGFQKADLLTALTADRTALLTELRDSELLKDLQSYDSWGDGHNTLARDIKAYINNLINPVK